MKKLQFFFMLVLISLLGVTQVKADTTHVQMPGGIQSFCQADGFDTFIFHKSAGFGPTVWKIDGVLAGSGDNFTFIPSTVGTFVISCVWSGAEDYCGLQLYPTPPSPVTYVINGNGNMDATQNNMYMCGPEISIGFYGTGGVGGDFYWRRLDNINWVSTSIPVIISDPGVYIHINENICGFTRDTFNVIALPYVAPLLTDTIFCNQTSNTTFDAGPGWSSISWSTGESTQSITPVITTDGVHNYTLTVTNVCGTFNSGASIEVQHFPLPGFPINIGPYCDTTFIIDPNYTYEYDTYLWSTGATTRTIYVNDDLSWTCTVTQGGCSANSSRTLRFYEAPLIPEVCVVTVDASMIKNKIVWSSDEEPDAGDPEYKMIESYNIYKLINTWTLIGTVPVDSDHVFTDMSSNPPTQSAMYKITAVDGCGNESEKSPYHRTILLLANQGAYPGQIPLSWNHYVDESGSFVVSQYYIYKGPSMSQLSLWDSVPGIMNSYIDTGIYAQTFYQIVATKDGGCNFAPAMVMTPGKGGNSPKSIQDGMIFSNPTSSQVGITENKIDVTIYPNPSSNGIFTVKGENINLIRVYNTVGQLIFETTESNTSQEINLSNYGSGIYYATIANNLGSTSKKLVKQ